MNLSKPLISNCTRLIIKTFLHCIPMIFIKLYKTEKLNTKTLKTEIHTANDNKYIFYAKNSCLIKNKA